VAVADRDAFFALVRAGFSAPRKQLRNSLSHGLDVPGAEVGEFLEGLNLDGSRRAETLTIEEWAALYRGWETRTTQTE
jgi:16S rRNA (adenine1518-N6/adenine1519-N6)-dimethyltransferase